MSPISLALRPGNRSVGALCSTRTAQVFELATSQPLFRYQRNSKLGLTEVENMLYQMQLLTDAYFEPAQLSASPRAGE